MDRRPGDTPYDASLLGRAVSHRLPGDGLPCFAGLLGGMAQEENRLWTISDRSIRALSPFRMILISPDRSTLPSAILLERIRIGNTGG